MDGFFPLVAVRFSNLVNSFKDASMVKLVRCKGDVDYKSWPCYLPMSRFLLGDQLGNIKVLRYSPQENGVDIKTVYQENAPASSVERLAINSGDSTRVRTNLHYISKFEIYS